MKTINGYFWHITLFLFISWLCTTAAAQTFTLKGRIVDEEHNPIELANISIPSQKVFKMSDLNGKFNVVLQQEDSVVVSFSMVGYQTRKRVFKRPTGTLNIEVMLPPLELGEVVVTERRRQTTQEQKVDIKNVKTMPSTTGNAVEEMIQQQAGVSTHSELSSQYNVRGGSFDENSVYINQIELYRPFLIRSGQQEGLSVINSDMVETVNFSAGGFAAKYGDKMSSALDIQYKRLAPDTSSRKRIITEGTANASLLGGGAYFGIGTRHLSWLNSVRYKTNKYMLGSLEEKGEYRPSFLDYQSYLSWRPNNRWTIDVIGNISDNHYEFVPKDRMTTFGTLSNVKSFRVYFDGQEKDLFRTYFGSLSLTHHFTPQTQVSLIGSAFRTNEQETYDLQGQYWLEQTETSENLGVGTYMEHARNYLKANVFSLRLIGEHKMKSHHIQGGLTWKKEHIRENSREYEMRDSSGYSMPHYDDRLQLIYALNARNEVNTHRLEVFLQDTYKFKGADLETFYTLNYGVRFSHWNFNKESLFSPRVSLGVVPKFNPDIIFRFATGLYYQTPFYKELRDTNLVNGVTEATLNQKIKSQRSIHFIAGMDYRFRMKDRPYMVTAEIYYKALSNLIPYNVNNVKIVYYGENTCTGYAAGIDFKIYGEFVPGADSWVSFSYMRAKQKMKGKWVPIPTDQGFSANLFFTDFFPGTTRWKMTLKGTYAGGLPFGPPHTGLERMNFRAPAYRRVDIGMSYRLLNNEERKRKSIPFKNVWLGLDCFNIFGISNVNSYYWITDIANHQYAVPNYLTGRQINGRLLVEF